MNVRELRGRLPEAPEEFSRAILESRARIRCYERGRTRRNRALLAASVAAVMLGGAIAGMNGPRRAAGDRTAAPVPAAQVEILAAELEPGAEPDFAAASVQRIAQVFTHPGDECYHAGRDCPLCRTEAVAMPPETAREFGKAPCPACLGGEERQETRGTEGKGEGLHANLEE